MTTGADIVACARTYVQTTRWRHQGVTKGVAVDCIGLIGCVAAEVGVSDAWLSPASSAFKGYGRQPNPDVLYQACAEFMRPVTPWTSVQLGDVLLMRFEREPMHFAFVSALDPMYIIHSYAAARRVVEHIVDATWRSRIVCAYRLPGVE